MDKKAVGMLLGVAGVILWFMPFLSVKMGDYNNMFHGLQLHQAGHHIGGIAYLLIISSAIYAVSAWLLNKQISIVAAVVTLGISAWLVIQVGSSVAWGLISLVAVAIASLILALTMDKHERLDEGKHYRAFSPSPANTNRQPVITQSMLTFECD